MIPNAPRQAHWTDFDAPSTIRAMHVPPQSEIRELRGHPLPVFVVDTAHELARVLARELVEVVRGEQAAGRAPVLGFATGRTPLALYAEFARVVAEERVDDVDADRDAHVLPDHGALRRDVDHDPHAVVRLLGRGRERQREARAVS